MHILVFQISSYPENKKPVAAKTLEIHSVQSCLKGSGSRFVFHKLSDYWCGLIRSSSPPESIQKSVQCCYRKF